jgi:ribosome-associated toxin RatA of RatAB toxin-antitoxin module
MLMLVGDIESYPAFLHWCRQARIDRRAENVVEATLDVGVSGIHRTLRTRNTTDGSHGSYTIRIDMIEGPLKTLRGLWTFSDSDSGGCLVDLSLEYEMHRTPFGLLLRSLFDEIANSQLNAFIRRADARFGNKPDA